MSSARLPESGSRLVAAKFRRPRRRTSILPRPRLIALLREGRGRLLTLVSAPAGYGKSTVLSQWASEDGAATPFAWLSVDEHDSDPVRLWSHVVHALQSVHAPVGETSLEAFAHGPAALIGEAIPRLCEELEDAPDMVVVIEDWHALTSPISTEALDLFVRTAPPCLQIVVSTRVDPALPLARLRARGELLEVRSEQLSVTLAETEELCRRLDLHLDADDVALLADRTEGWVTGLHLAGMLMADHPDRRAFIAAFSGESRHVLEYLAGDVLETLPADERDFLLHTSILDRFTAELCDWVTGTRGSAVLLRRIERANLFVVPLDSHGRSYRYHHLFAGTLRRHLLTADPTIVPVLHARASAWFELHGDIELAVEHAIESRDVGLASALVARHAADFWAIGRVGTVIRWFGALSWPEAQADGQLAVVRAGSLANGGRSADEIEHWLAVAAAASHDGPLANGVASLDSGIALIRSLFLTRGVAAALAAARVASDREPDSSPWRRQASLALGQALYLDGRPTQALVPLEEARRLPGERDQPAAAANVLGNLALVRLDGGDIAGAERLAAGALRLLADCGHAGSVIAATAHIAAGATHAARASFRDAIDQLTLALAAIPPDGVKVWRAHALLRRAAARHRIGDLAAARADLAEAHDLLASVPDAGMLAGLAADVDRQVSSRPRRTSDAGEDLTERELHLLRMLETDLSQRQIAEQLYLTVNTVKSHTRSIYRKLDTRARTDTIRRAHELGLLDRAPTAVP